MNAAGGRGVPVVCDMADDAQVRALFDRVRRDSGRLDILVNNAAFLHNDMGKPGPFWERSLEMADIIDVGLRCHFVATWCAAPASAPIRADRKPASANTPTSAVICSPAGKPTENARRISRHTGLRIARPNPPASTVRTPTATSPNCKTEQIAVATAAPGAPIFGIDP